MRKFIALVLLSLAFGCSTDTTPTLPANITDEPPGVGVSTGGSDSDKGAPGETMQLKPR